MGQFPAFPTACYGFTYRSWGFTPGRFRISEIPGSEAVCAYPRLIAAKPRLSSALGAKASPRTALSLLMSAWSLLYSPAVLTVDLQPEQNAPLPLI